MKQLFLTIAVLLFLFFCLGFYPKDSFAACGVQIAGRCSDCSLVCFQWCINRGNPTCENVNDPTQGPTGCCYNGMDTSCSAATGQCQCDDWLDNDPSNDPWTPLPPVCSGLNQLIPPAVSCGGPNPQVCCSSANECPFPTATPTPVAQATPTPVAQATPTPVAQATPTPGLFSPYSPVTNETFNAVNPLLIGGGDSIDQSVPSQYAAQLSTPGGIISRALTFIFPLAGLVLFVLLVWGGFEMLIGSPTKKSMDAGKQRVTAAVAGFFLLFAAYWIWQIIEIVFGVKIL